jgi:hypothetical protein
MSSRRIKPLHHCLFERSLSADNEENQIRIANMTTSRPDSLTVPSLDAYPFINAVHFHHNVSFKHNVIQQDQSPNSKADEEFEVSFFQEPSYVSDPAVAAVQAMSDETFARLMKILQPRAFGSDIVSRQTLETITASNLNRFHDEESYTDDQLQTYILSKALTTQDIHWGHLAELYNGAEPGQQEAIHQYFLRCMNRDLSVLMSTPPVSITIPEKLQETFQSKDVDGEKFLFSDLQQQWVREDILHKQYRVDAYHRSTQEIFLLGSAPTLNQAIAKATAYVEKATGSMVSDLIVLRQQGKYLAQGEFKMAKDFPDDADLFEMIMSPYKLKWNFEQLGEDLGNLRAKGEKLLQEIENTKDSLIIGQLKQQVSEIDLRLSKTVKVSEKEFTKAVFFVEKTMGLQWNRVSKLEDALGL